MTAIAQRLADFELKHGWLLVFSNSKHSPGDILKPEDNCDTPDDIEMPPAMQVLGPGSVADAIVMGHEVFGPTFFPDPAKLHNIYRVKSLD